MSDNYQEALWGGQKGTAYSERFVLDSKQVDDKWVRVIAGVPKSVIHMRHFAGVVPKDASILEVGCNTGNMLSMLREQGWQNLTGLELNERAVELARARGLAVECGNARKLPFEDRSFDLVFTCWCLGHIDPVRLDEALREIHRVSDRWISGCEQYTPGKRPRMVHRRYLWAHHLSWRYRRMFPVRTINREIYSSPVTGQSEMFLLERND
jgi:SAM-dependent methyltransferase